MPQNAPKKMSRRKRERELNFLKQTIRRALVLCYVLLFTDLVNFGQSRLSGFSLGEFMNFTR